MKKSNSKTFQKTLTLAATVAALGASLGVPVERALAASPAGDPVQMSGPNSEAVQAKLKKRRETGATQMKWRANQYKENKAKTPAGPGSNNMVNPGPSQRSSSSAAGSPGGKQMLNPQPLPPKQGRGLAGEQLPAAQK